ncbi:quinic acid utilization activator [Trichoderma arundinaceum]|uniref:Quinic acid utilization activator n=1 Tax=Trichoderma arundinaceum TaxID=490622 RepID=A0A395NVN4_TRIAR|nr:quinic acid utilization activator [Trichoderma arundinaceum]
MRRRGLKSGYVRALECLWGLVFQSIEGSERSVRTLIASTSSEAFWVRDEARDGSKSGQSPLESWKSSEVPGAIHSLISNDADDAATNDEITISTDIHTQTEVASLTWNWVGQSLPTQLSQPQKPPPVSRNYRKLQPPVSVPSGTGGDGTDQKTNTYSESTLVPRPSPELPQNAQKLLNRFFAITHSWFPILNRHAIYRNFFALRKSLASNSAGNWKTGENAVLWAIFAYMTTMEGPPSSSTPWNNHVNDFYMTARGMLPLEIEDTYSACHVQTLLILGLLHYASSEHRVARTVVAQATVLASHIEIDQRDKCPTEYDRRIWIGCFVLDTLISANAGKAPRIHSQMIRDFLPIDETGSEEWEPWQLQEALLPDVAIEAAEFAAPTHVITVFASFIELLCIFNDFLSANRAQSDDKCKQALESWSENIPDHIKALMRTNMDSATTTLLPPNLLNIYAVHSVLDTALSYASSQPTGFIRGLDWQTIIRAVGDFCNRFDQRILPPSFNLLRNVLSPKVADGAGISEIISKLKQEISENGSLPSNFPYGTSKRNRNQSRNATNANHDATACNLGERMEQNFASFIEMPGTWSNTTTELLLEPHDRLENTMSRPGLPNTMPGLNIGLSTPAITSTDIGFNDWDDIEIEDPGQFRRNLGFMS